MGDRGRDNGRGVKLSPPNPPLSFARGSARAVWAGDTLQVRVNVCSSGVEPWGGQSYGRARCELEEGNQGVLVIMGLC